jgi:serine/threonine-protein kinase RsbW
VQLDVALCLPKEGGSVALIRGVVRDALVTLGVSRECVEDVRLALSEACTNVLDHAVAGDEYEVRMRVDDERCHVTVTNAGSGFDASALEGVMPDALSPRGRGVAMMRAVMDNVDFTSEPETGTIVHLVKTLTFDPSGPLARLRRARDTTVG